MQKKTKGWPEKRRREQARRARKQKPWKLSTGPTSAAGKTICAENAYKHGFRSRDMVEIRALLKRQKALIKAISASLQPQRPV